MIDPDSINLSLLPSIPLARRKELPELPPIYFVMDSQGEICYIGQTKNLYKRLIRHHHLPSFKNLPNAKVAYLKISDINLLTKIEKVLIDYFRPSLNWVQAKSRRRQTKSITMDTIIWDAVKKHAARQGISISRWSENLLFDGLQNMGLIDKNLSKLGDTGSYNLPYSTTEYRKNSE